MLHWCTQFSRKKLCGFVVPIWGCIMNLPCVWSVLPQRELPNQIPEKMSRVKTPRSEKESLIAEIPESPRWSKASLVPKTRDPKRLTGSENPLKGVNGCENLKAFRASLVAAWL